MSSTSIAIKVPYTDRQDLEKLRNDLQTDQEIIEARALDGVTLATIVFYITTAAVPTLTTWIRNRVKEKKELRVSYNGKEIRGYSAEDAERIINAINKEATPIEQAPGGDA